MQLSHTLTFKVSPKAGVASVVAALAAAATSTYVAIKTQVDLVHAKATCTQQYITFPSCYWLPLLIMYRHVPEPH